MTCPIFKDHNILLPFNIFYMKIVLLPVIFEMDKTYPLNKSFNESMKPFLFYFLNEKQKNTDLQKKGIDLFVDYEST